MMPIHPPAHPFPQTCLIVCLVSFLLCFSASAEDSKREKRTISVPEIQDLKFHMNSGKISFSEKGQSYELFPPPGTRESRIDIGTKLLAELRLASVLTVEVYTNDEGEPIVQPHSWVFHYRAEN